LQLSILDPPGGGRGRCREGAQSEDGCEETAAHAESIFRA
jgi:hypothetical protein